MTRDARNAWILARKAEGCWVTICLVCGDLFAQKRLGQGHGARRAELCDRKCCFMAKRYQRTYGRMPPRWLILKWHDEHGDTLKDRCKEPYARPEAA